MYLTTTQLAESLDGEWLLAAADLDRDGAADTAVLTAAIASAQAAVDAALAARYDVPLDDPAPEVVGEIAAILAAEALAARRPALSLAPAMEERLVWARGVLGQLAAGTLALPGVAARLRADNTRRMDSARPLRDGGIEAF